MVKVMGKMRNPGLSPWIKKVQGRGRGLKVLVLVSVVGMKRLVKLPEFDWVWTGFEWLKGPEWKSRLGI